MLANHVDQSREWLRRNGADLHRYGKKLGEDG